ncbi:hypothetical protein Syun_009929 [Stephania yunnanensis]|uniref:Uncharacterized protein n=1 Tax=Stephania yunnanensis TaxID=152371 RepID=A0AAP0KI41_9MAGN
MTKREEEPARDDGAGRSPSSGRGRRGPAARSDGQQRRRAQVGRGPAASADSRQAAGRQRRDLIRDDNGQRRPIGSGEEAVLQQQGRWRRGEKARRAAAGVARWSAAVPVCSGAGEQLHQQGSDQQCGGVDGQQTRERMRQRRGSDDSGSDAGGGAAPAVTLATWLQQRRDILTLTKLDDREWDERRRPCDLGCYSLVLHAHIEM